MGVGEWTLHQHHNDGVVAASEDGLRSKIGTANGQHGARELDALRADDRCVVDAQLATVRAKRSRSFLRYVRQIRASHLEPDGKDARRSGGASGARSCALRGADADAGWNADWCRLQPDRRQSRLGRKSRKYSE